MAIGFSLKRRPLWARLLRLPGTWLGHYRLLRKSGTPSLEAATAALDLTLVLLK